MMRTIIISGLVFRYVASVCAVVVALTLMVFTASTQEPQQKSIGGLQHEDNILGVRIGMDVPTALETIFVHSGRRAGQERPDAKRDEGKDNKDTRVLYKGLKDGEVQIVFANRQWVKEILLVYTAPRPIDDLRLPYSSSIGAAIAGQRYDDRYVVGYTGTNKLEQFWWRDENTPDGYRIRIGFISGKRTVGGAQGITTIARKIITVKPEDEQKFLRDMAGP